MYWPNLMNPSSEGSEYRSAKPQLRREVRQRRARRSESAIALDSAAILSRVLTLVGNAARVAVYAPMRGEPDFIDAWLARSARSSLAFPVCDPDDRTMRFYTSELRPTHEGAHGVREPARDSPVHPSLLDFIIVPGLAFDPSGHRLGQGAGYYDRFLARFCKAIPRVGVCYTDELVDAIPFAPHDVRMTHVVTPDVSLIVSQ